jgi:molybdate transport system substrate-binding protein
MSDSEAKWSQDWSVGLRLWTERRGKAILGKGRLELLEQIGRWHSISRAAREMGMSYRRAWLLVQDVNDAAGEPLVEAAVGGRRGGGAQLTARGREAVRIFRELERQVVQKAALVLPQLIEIRETRALHLAAAVSLEEVLGQLLADYALHQPAVQVRAVFGGSDELVEHLLSGAPGDLILSADEMQIDRLDRANLLEPGTRVAVAENTLAVIAPIDRAVRITTAKDLLRGDKIAIALPACPLGKYTSEWLAGLGLYDSLVAKALQVDNSRAVLSAVHAGQADLGIVYGSDAASDPGCRIVYRFRKSGAPIVYSAAVLRGGKQVEAARALLAFMSSPQAAARFRECGFRLPPRKR